MLTSRDYINVIAPLFGETGHTTVIFLIECGITSGGMQSTDLFLQRPKRLSENRPPPVHDRLPGMVKQSKSFWLHQALLYIINYQYALQIIIGVDTIGQKDANGTNLYALIV
jgi:hypothetical protein